MRIDRSIDKLIIDEFVEEISPFDFDGLNKIETEEFIENLFRRNGNDSGLYIDVFNGNGEVHFHLKRKRKETDEEYLERRNKVIELECKEESEQMKLQIKKDKKARKLYEELKKKFENE